METAEAESQLKLRGRLIVVSNRAPFRVIREGDTQRVESTVGGVATTFLRLLQTYGGVWVAWSGNTETPGTLSVPEEAPRFSIVFRGLSEREITHYYWGMCNRGLWPLMHLMPLNCHFVSRDWRTYRTVNHGFADLCAAQLKPGDTVWIQDFHLALMPQMLRERVASAPIGLFWHVPFPPEEVLRIFPWHAELLQGMLGADVVGFHTAAVMNAFVDCCEKILGLRVDRTAGVVLKDGRPVRVGVFPIGVAVDYFEALAADPRVKRRSERLRRHIGAEKIVLGVDRLDYTKGLLRRLDSFERFLEDNPGYCKRVTLVQIAVPSRTRVPEYLALKHQVEQRVARIVSRFARDGWLPVRYLYTQYEPEDLVAYYLAADVALVTPLRDGMNLVAKEYVASRPGDDGVLVLSELAGAADELKDALLVNPYDIDQIAQQLKRALEMEPQERIRRLNALRAAVRHNTLTQWSESFLGALEAAAGHQT